MRENLKLYRILFVFLFCFGLLCFASTNVKADDFTPNEGYENENYDDSYDDSYSEDNYENDYDESYEDNYDYSDDDYDDSYDDDYGYSDENYDDFYSNEYENTDNSDNTIDEIPDVSYDSPDKTDGGIVSSPAGNRSFENDTIAARMKGNAKKREVSVMGTVMWSIFLLLLLMVVIAAISGGIASYKEEKRRKNNGRPKIIISDGYIRGNYEVRPRNAPNAKPNERMESLDELNKKGEYD